MGMFSLIMFIPACFALNMVPGPNNLLAMSNAQRLGFNYAIAAGVGRLFAFAGMIFLAATGLATILYASETLFLTIKITGACYLLWVAFQLWTSNTSAAIEIAEQRRTLMQLVKQEFLLAAGNPKAILIFTAFLPQFIDPSYETGHQFFILGSVFLLLELLAISIYAFLGVYLRQWFAKPAMRKLFNRGCAAFIASIGIGLLVERNA